MFSANVGGIDAVIRVIVGLGLIVFALVGPDTAITKFGWIGVIPLVTAFINFCPAYKLLGLSTRKAAE